MTPKIAPEIEELMWALAEKRDPQALDEFGQRFPELRQELGKRLLLTQGLKSASVASRPHSIPRFRPPVKPAPWWSRPVAVAATAVVLVVLALGSYTLTQTFNQGEPDVVHGTSPEPPVLPDKQPPENVDRDLNGVPYHEQPQDQPKDPVVQKDPEPLPPYMEPKSLEIKGTPFPQVLAMIEQSCGIDIEMPDMPADMLDMDVEVSYQNMNGFEMLANLGSKYGFTAFRQGANKVLIVPARDVTAETTGGQ